MKTSIYTSILTGLLFTGLTSFAGSANNNSEKNLKVPVAQKIVDLKDYDAPEMLAHIKAKNAMVPLAPFTFGRPDESQNLFPSRIPVPFLVWGDPQEEIPAGLTLKVKSLNVPLAPRVVGDPISDLPSEI